MKNEYSGKRQRYWYHQEYVICRCIFIGAISWMCCTSRASYACCELTFWQLHSTIFRCCVGYTYTLSPPAFLRRGWIAIIRTVYSVITLSWSISRSIINQFCFFQQLGLIIQILLQFYRLFPYLLGRKILFKNSDYLFVRRPFPGWAGKFTVGRFLHHFPTLAK